MGEVDGERFAVWSTKLQHFAANRGEGRYAGDRLNHLRYRDFAMIPAADFLQ
jgi:hypothetical protein